MTLVIECSGPFQWKPGIFRSRIMSRVWWGWFAVGLLHIPFHEYGDASRFEWMRE